MKLKSVLITIRILAVATAVGLFAYWLLSLAPPAWFKWFLIVIGAMVLGMVVSQNGRGLAELRKREWLRLFDRTQRIEDSSPESLLHVDEESNVHVTECPSNGPAVKTKADDRVPSIAAALHTMKGAQSCRRRVSHRHCAR